MPMEPAFGGHPSPGLKQMPAASVVLLNWNGEKLLPRCLDHLMAQTFEDFEVIVVDNASDDNSLAVARPYLAGGKVSIVRAPRNLGVAGGRNLGTVHARGNIIAFIDNDGYADRRWLAELMALFEARPEIGAAGSLVFFDGNKALLNSAGGTANLQGYGEDHCFGIPYEFARLPEEILYPMGCGMAVRSGLWRRIGPLDGRLVNYYDDLELGLRIWKSGAKVVLAPRAIIDHGFSSADRVLHNKALLCERNRIRSVLKYYPLRLLPIWLWHELSMWRGAGREARAMALRVAWWNFCHLPSALLLRMRFGAGSKLPMHLIERRWGHFPPVPEQARNHADPEKGAARLSLDGVSDRHGINFGWWPAQCEDSVRYRLTAPHASALFKIGLPAYCCIARLRAATPGCRLRMLVRSLGSLEPIAHQEFYPLDCWREFTMRSRLAPGRYEVILTVDPIGSDKERRTVGVAVSEIRLE